MLLTAPGQLGQRRLGSSQCAPRVPDPNGASPHFAAIKHIVACGENLPSQVLGLGVMRRQKRLRRSDVIVGIEQI